MQVTVNGTPQDLPHPTTVTELLRSFGLDIGRTVVEYNRSVLPRDRFDQTRLVEGDVLELVEIVGGG